jgi:steroid delta-isomerase-like uncharacterized protein
MSAEQNKENARRVIEEIWNQGNLDLVDELYAPTFVNHTPTPGSTPDCEGIKQDVSQTRSAFPDGSLAIDDIIADEETVVTRWTFTGTHTEELWGIPATGRRVSFTGIHINRIVNGQSTEEWSQSDVFGMMQQLGIIPSPEAAAG